MNELLDSLAQTIKRRVSNPILGTFSVFYILSHWNFFVILFFVNEDKILFKTGLLKNQYLIQTFFNYKSINDWALLVLPFLLTYAYIWILPKYILIPALKKEEDYRAAKKIIRIENDIKIRLKENELEERDLKKLEIQLQKVKEERAIEKLDFDKNPTDEWVKEYEKFENLEYFYKFDLLIESIYRNNGYLTNVPRDLIAYSDANKLIDILDNKAKLTEKGKFFLKMFTQSNKKNII